MISLKEVSDKEVLIDLTRARELLGNFYKPYKNFFNKLSKENIQVRTYVCSAFLESISHDVKIDSLYLVAILEKIKFNIQSEQDKPEPIKSKSYIQ